MKVVCNSAKHIIVNCNVQEQHRKNLEVNFLSFKNDDLVKFMCNGGLFYFAWRKKFFNALTDTETKTYLNTLPYGSFWEKTY